jgi:ribosomal protein S18 acetylase RimI-like enzyme
MELVDSFQAETSSSEFQIISYCPSLHHDKIPLIYSASFEERSWDGDWDNFSEFDPNGVFLAINIKTNEPIGYVISFTRDNFGHISVVAVMPNWQRRGVASALIKAAVEHFCSLKIKTIKIDVEETNIPAIKVYEKVGFIVIEKFED